MIHCKGGATDQWGEKQATHYKAQGYQVFHEGGNLIKPLIYILCTQKTKFKTSIIWGTWVAKSDKGLTLAQLVISGS